MIPFPGAAGRTAVLLAALLGAGPPPLKAAAPPKPARTAVSPRRPDSALFLEAQQAEAALKASPRLAGRTGEWEGGWSTSNLQFLMSAVRICPPGSIIASSGL